METKKILVLGKEYLFVNEYFRNRSGFVHRSVLLVNNCEYSSHKVQYYNRTWESYRYQTVMKGLVCNLIDNERDCYLRMIKSRNGWTRFPKGKKTEYQKLFESSERYKPLELLLNSL